MESPTRSGQSKTAVHRIEISVDWPPGHVAAYLIDGPEPILVDAGMAGEDARAELQEGLAAADRSLSDIEHLIITHPHVDHIGQVPAIIETADPTIYAPVGIRTRFARDSEDLARAVRANARKAGLRGGALEDVVEKSVDSLERNRALLDSESVDEWVSDGQQITVGGHTLEAIHTPGHQADHLCFDTEINDRPTLFSGDILLEPFRSVMIHTGLDDGVEDAVPAFFEALDRLDELGPRMVFPGHGPEHDAPGEMVERSRNDIERMLTDTLSHVAAKQMTIFELAKTRASERSFHYVLPEVHSALTYLDAQDEVFSMEEDGTTYYHADTSP